MNIEIKSLNKKYVEEKLIESDGETRAIFRNINAKDTISSFKDNIIDPQQLKGKPGIGNTIFEKLVEYKNTGTLTILQREESARAVGRLASLHFLSWKLY